MQSRLGSLSRQRFANIDAGGDGKISLPPDLELRVSVPCTFTQQEHLIDVGDRCEFLRAHCLRLEFFYFARQNLRLTAYDVGDIELKQFYKSLPPADRDKSRISERLEVHRLLLCLLHAFTCLFA